MSNNRGRWKVHKDGKIKLDFKNPTSWKKEAKKLYNPTTLIKIMLRILPI